MLGLVGLGVRGRTVVVGVGTGAGGRRRRARCIWRSSRTDVSPPFARQGGAAPAGHGGYEVIEWPSAAELGAAVGRETTAAVGIVDQALARGIRGAREPAAASAGDASARFASRRKG